MDKWTEGDLTPSPYGRVSRAISYLLFSLLSIVALWFIWFLWCIYHNPCFDVSSKRCKEFALTEDRDNPRTSPINLSYLKKPATLVYPLLSMIQKEEGSVVISIEIDEKGQIISRKVVESSGYDLLDTAALTSTSTFAIDLKKLESYDFPVERRVKVTFRLAY
ncbi:energy transducer TonB [Microbulbifer harenosus]|uniref:TonB family protein n=1 Tax=Microbulbifer harenosus TaxID=2576840 RepID=A0ABY2UCK9_9GAMM|nr:energy transducer TonB [Microbulbifer harenosus]TLM73409.1 TonB family protein [Microbulbifer harenosus]